MTNITIAIDEEIHRLARFRAAGPNTSASALVGEYLRSLVGLDHAEEGVGAQSDETERFATPEKTPTRRTPASSTKGRCFA